MAKRIFPSAASSHEQQVSQTTSAFYQSSIPQIFLFTVQSQKSSIPASLNSSNAIPNLSPPGFPLKIEVS